MPLSYQDVHRCFWQCGAKMYISESSILFVCHLLACRQQQQLLAQPGRGQCPIRLITSMLRMLLISCTHPTHLRLNPRSRLYSYCQKHAGHLHLVGLRCAEWDCDMSAAAVLVIGQYIAHFAASSNFTSLGPILLSLIPASGFSLAILGKHRDIMHIRMPSAGLNPFGNLDLSGTDCLLAYLCC